MEIRMIEKNDKRHVKAVFLDGIFAYTITYILNDDGYVAKMIKVYADGTVEIQQGGKSKLY